MAGTAAAVMARIAKAMGLDANASVRPITAVRIATNAAVAAPMPETMAGPANAAPNASSAILLSSMNSVRFRTTAPIPTTAVCAP